MQAASVRPLSALWRTAMKGPWLTLLVLQNESERYV